MNPVHKRLLLHLINFTMNTSALWADLFERLYMEERRHHALKELNGRMQRINLLREDLVNAPCRKSFLLQSRQIFFFSFCHPKLFMCLFLSLKCRKGVFLILKYSHLVKSARYRTSRLSAIKCLFYVFITPIATQLRINRHHRFIIPKIIFLDNNFHNLFDLAIVMDGPPMLNCSCVLKSQQWEKLHNLVRPNKLQ